MGLTHSSSYCGRARNSIGRRLVRWWVMWGELIAGAVVIAAIFGAAGYWLDRYQHRSVFAAAREVPGLRAENAAQRTEIAACAAEKKIAQDIDNTPTGSRTDAGRVLANNTITNQGRK